MREEPEHGPAEARARGRVRQRSKRSPFAGFVTARLVRRIRVDETAGWPIIAAAFVALVWSNLLWPATYEAVWTTHLSVSVGPWTADASLREVVNAVLIPLFFLVIGIEIREEFSRGHLSDPARAWMPLCAAAGGMLVPAAFYLSVTLGTPYWRGFGVPVATDVALVVALLMILGDRVPDGLRAFLLAFAAVDDIGGVIVIAAAYGHGVSWPWLGGVIVMSGVCLGAFRARPHPWAYLVLGLALWFTVVQAGVHPTIAGVLFGLLLPIRPLFRPDEVAEHSAPLLRHLQSAADEVSAEETLGRLEELAARSEAPASRVGRLVQPFVSYAILPVFGLAAVGTSLNADAWAGVVSHPGAVGIVLGLVLGKPLGVFLFSWLGARLGLARLPRGLHWGHILGAAALSSMGFTVSLFIAELAFDPVDLVPVKLAIFASSVLGGALGLLILLTARPGSPVEPAEDQP